MPGKRFDEHWHLCCTLVFSLPVIDRSAFGQHVDASSHPLIDQFLSKRHGPRPIGQVSNDEYGFHLDEQVYWGRLSFSLKQIRFYYFPWHSLQFPRRNTSPR